jgi:hypothetical protein
MNIRPDFNLIERIAADLRDMLGDDFDEVTFLDTLDGETDAADIADKLIAAMQEADAMADAVRTLEADLRTRRSRFDARSDAFRKQMLSLLDAAGVKKLERPAATISRRAGLPSVQITDESAVPSQLCKTTVTPDKAAIKAQLLAGEAVPGAVIVMGDDGVTVRSK